MGLLSSTVSITRYKVQGRLAEPILDTIGNGLKDNAASEIDNDAVEKSVGWTSFETPFSPGFEGSAHLLGTHLVFSLRIDRKSIPPKIVKKHYTLEIDKRLAKSGRSFISSSEKKLVKEQVLHSLCLRIPATPNVYDLIWNYEEGKLWFFTNLKAANEELESLFTKSFKLSLIRMFPYTSAELTADLSDSERDVLYRLSPTDYRR
jgi:DNA recombination-dependent growth factor C